MQRTTIKKTLVSILAFCLIESGFADSDLSSIGSSITNNANNQLVNAINLPLPFVVSVWSMMSNYYSTTSAFAPTGLYAVDTSILSNVTSINNTSYGTLEIRYGANAPGPMANNGYALAPTRVTQNGNTFYIYELPQCFTNIISTVRGLVQAREGANSDAFGNSNLGTNCVYAANPFSAAIAEVEGTGTAPQSDNLGVTA